MLKRIAILASLVVVFSLPSLGATVGMFEFTKNAANIGKEFSGPLAYWVSVAMVAIGAWYWFSHRGELGTIGGSAVALLFVVGFGMNAPAIVSAIAGATGLSV